MDVDVVFGDDVLGDVDVVFKDDNVVNVWRVIIKMMGVIMMDWVWCYLYCSYSCC